MIYLQKGVEYTISVARSESQSKGPQFMIRAGGVGSLHQNKEKTNDFHNSLFSLSSVKGGEAKTKFFISIFVKQTNY